MMWGILSFFILYCQENTSFFDKEVNIVAPYLREDYSLKPPLDSAFWSKIPSTEITMFHKDMKRAWASKEGIVKRVYLKTYRSARFIYFYLEWQDETMDTIFREGIYPDACSILFDVEPPEKHDSMKSGFYIGKVNVWFWQAHRNHECLRDNRAGACVEELTGKSSSYKFQKDTSQSVEGVGHYFNGKWVVIMRRRIEPADGYEPYLGSGARRIMGVAVWNGSRGDHKGEKSASMGWINLRVE